MRPVPITVERLREVLHYEPETGEFRWLQTRSGRHGPVGIVERVDGKYGRLIITIDYGRYKAHRLAWLYMEGKWPDGNIDHIDRNPLNNAWNNLRESTPKINSRNRRLNKNNTSGTPGVFWDKNGQVWKVYLGKKFIRNYSKKEDAVRVAVALRKDWDWSFRS